ncbi:MAG: ligand-binding protein [Bacteroidetes bacterium MedPE-SWsnd-G2]|nr:MAG: ligand-binding protein [Bacteroidetes bacterium MedPE-SWsnd-G2]
MTFFKTIGLGILCLLLCQSCASKKEVLYFQDIDQANIASIDYEASKIQASDILSIKVGAPIPETAIPYNVNIGALTATSVDILKLQGYLVSDAGTINFPVLGAIEVTDKTVEELEVFLKGLLESGGHLKDASVAIRVLNSKVTILGEVTRPGTYTYTEQHVTLLQALGLAGDLTINGEREDVMVIREENGVRQVGHVNMTTADWFTGPYYYVKQNDVIVVNPNNTKVKSSGYVGNLGAVLGIASIILSTVILITN